MEVTCWILIEGKKTRFGLSGWEAGAIKLTKGKPKTARNQVALKLTLMIPSAIFDEPQLHAIITIPEDAISKPVIDADIQENIVEILSERLGFHVHISAEQDE